jgi:hypothetical protein
MAQDSGFWDHFGGGDADTAVVWQSKYSGAERADWFSKLVQSNAAHGLVIPDYGNELKVVADSPVSLDVIVRSGALEFRGWMYENTDDEVLTLAAANGSNPRLDRIVARLTPDDQEIRVAVVTGTPAATPSLPALTQTADTYEIDLAWVWVATSAVSVAQSRIWDQREFASNLYEMLIGGQENLLKNSEFLGLDNGWTIAKAAAGFATKPAQMERGRPYQIVGSGVIAPSFSQTVRVKSSTSYAIRALVYVDAGTDWVFSVTTNSAAPGSQALDVTRVGTWLEIKVYYTTEADATTMSVNFASPTASAGRTGTAGQWMVMQGHVTGPFRAFHEVIPFEKKLTQSTLAGVARSTSNVVVDLTATFGVIDGVTVGQTITDGVRGLMLRIQGNDSGSAAGVAKMDIRPGGAGTAVLMRLQLDGVPDDKVRSQNGMIPLLNNDLQFNVDITATGVTTFDATVEIVGILT